jgi:hypothetical protein
MLRIAASHGHEHLYKSHEAQRVISDTTRSSAQAPQKCRCLGKTTGTGMKLAGQKLNGATYLRRCLPL